MVSPCVLTHWSMVFMRTNQIWIGLSTFTDIIHLCHNFLSYRSLSVQIKVAKRPMQLRQLRPYRACTSHLQLQIHRILSKIVLYYLHKSFNECCTTWLTSTHGWKRVSLEVTLSISSQTHLESLMSFRRHRLKEPYVFYEPAASCGEGISAWKSMRMKWA